MRRIAWIVGMCTIAATAGAAGLTTSHAEAAEEVCTAKACSHIGQCHWSCTVCAAAAEADDGRVCGPDDET